MPSVPPTETPLDRPCSTSPQPASIGDWQLVRPLGAGRWTEVYAARPKASPATSPADYAVKVLRVELTDEAAARQMLKREARVGRQVHHTHLVPTLSSEFATTRPHLVQPLVAGQTLEDCLQTSGRLPIPLALWIARQTAEALAALHQQGWLHRDVKPANLIVSPTGHTTLIDLGFATRAGNVNSTEAQVCCGTLAQMAPECFASRQRIDARADLYSVGVTLFEMLTGLKPLTASSAAEWADAHLRQRPLRLEVALKGVPPKVVTLVHSLLAKQPERRPHSAAALADQLLWLEMVTFARHAA